MDGRHFWMAESGKLVNLCVPRTCIFYMFLVLSIIEIRGDTLLHKLCRCVSSKAMVFEPFCSENGIDFGGEVWKCVFKKNIFWSEGSGFGKLGGTPPKILRSCFPPPQRPRVKFMEFMDQLIGTSDMSDISNLGLLVVAVFLVVDRW